MQYNISFSIAAAAFFIVYYIFIKIAYNSRTEASAVFARAVLWVLIADVLDAITAITISYSDSFPIWANYLLNIIYYCSSAVGAFMIPRYIMLVVIPENKNNIIDKICMWFLHLYYVLIVTTPLTHVMFYFDEDMKYTHGSLYFLLFSVPFVFLLQSVIRVLRIKKLMTKRQYMPILVFTLAILVLTLFQFMFVPNVLLSYFGTSIGVLVLMFTLESPDYKNLNRTMEELKQARTEAEEAKEEAFAANRAKSSFLANMSHEIRTPINGILGMNEIALRENKDPEVEDCLINIQDAGKSLLSLINEILDFSKIESGKMEIVDNDYQLSSILYSTFNLINSKALDKNLVVKIENNPSLPAVLKGDAARIQQIMINLLNNSVKYTNEGHIELNVDYRESLEDVIDLMITVTDTGIGISDDNLDKLFQSFQRVDLEKNRNIEGTGLGLMITKQLAELMGGTIFVESKEGQGSKFSVIIPQDVVDKRPMGAFSIANTKPEAKVTNMEDDSFEGTKILVVDDVKVNLKVVCGLLKKTKITVDTALSGKECLEMCKETKYDAIFLDHMMPELDGVETLKLLRADTTGANALTPVVALTANAIQGIEQEYLQLGFNAYLSKPIDTNKLKEILKFYLSGAH